MTVTEKFITCKASDLRAAIRDAIREVHAELGQRQDGSLLTTQDAATYCNMSKRTLLRHVEQARLVPDSPAREGFRTHRFLRSTLDAFLLRV